eukprot:5474420-Alexandrium_andersonii.AAC.1
MGPAKGSVCDRARVDEVFVCGCRARVTVPHRLVLPTYVRGLNHNTALGQSLRERRRGPPE